MDKTTAGGLVGGMGLVALAIFLGGAGFGPYLDIPSVIIVIGGTACIIIAQFDATILKKFGKSHSIAMNEQNIEPIPELIEKIIIYATDIKKNGVMSVESKIQQEINPFFKEAFNLLVDNTKPDVLENLLEIKLEHMENRHKDQISVFTSISSVAGSMGMIGTLVGLVAMLANLSDPSAVGPAMAVALLTTMYGALIGNLYGGIFENKLSIRHSREMVSCQIIIQGSHMIASEESIGNIKMKLGAILPPEEEQQMGKDKCPECPKCLPGWLVQFGDLMSLLLVFFVLLLSMATMDKKKVEEYFEIMRRSMGFLQGSMDTAEAEKESLSSYHADKSQAGSGDDQGMNTEAADVAQLVEEVTQEFNDTSDKDSQKVNMTMKGNNEFTLDVPSSLMFEEGEYALTNPNAKRFIKKLSKILRTMTQQFDIEVMGHTGSNYLRSEGIPRDSWDLSALRSISVVKELIKNQVDPATLKVVAFGSYRPKSDNAFENRRVELRFTATSQDYGNMAAEENFFDRIEE